MSTDDFRERRIIKPQNERMALVPGQCGKCGEALVLRRELIDVTTGRRTRVKTFRVRGVKCHGCGIWLDGLTEKETEQRVKHPEDLKEPE